MVDLPRIKRDLTSLEQESSWPHVKAARYLMIWCFRATAATSRRGGAGLVATAAGYTKGTKQKMDNDGAVTTFMEITSCGSRESAVQLLTACRWDLETAINRYFVLGGAAFAARVAAPPPAPPAAAVDDVAPPAGDGDGVRAPIAFRSETLYGDAFGRTKPPKVRPPAPSVWGKPKPPPPPPSTPAVAPVYIGLDLNLPPNNDDDDDEQPGIRRVVGEEENKEEDGESKLKEQNEQHEDHDGYSDGDYGMETADDDDDYDGYDDMIEKTPSPPPASSRPKSLAEMYRLPSELMHEADFHSTKLHAARLDRWLLLNLQISGDFTSEMHNRDLWANERIAKIVRENFVFSLLENGDGDHDDEGSKVPCFYKLHDQLPAVAVIDPVTGQMLAKWSGVIDPEAFLVDIEEFIRSKPSARSKPEMFRRKPMPVPESSAPAVEIAEQQDSAMADDTAPTQEPDTTAAAVPMDEQSVAQESTSADACGMQQQTADDEHDDDDQPMEGEKIYRMRVRFPDGSVVTKEFGCKRRVLVLFNYVRSVLHEKMQPQAFKIKRLVGAAFLELPQGGVSFEDLGLNCATEHCTMEPGSSNTSSGEKRIAVVTGGNKGIGLEICKQLAAKGIFVVLTARDEERGAGAAAALRQLGLSDVLFHELDVTEPSSVACLADFIKHKFGKLDILVSNAGNLGVTFDFGNSELDKAIEGKSPNETLKWLMQHTVETTENAEECLRINYHGTTAVIQTLFPLLQLSSDGRIFFSGEKLKEELNDADKLSEERLDELAELFINDFKNGELESRGWPARRDAFVAYKTSKALQHAYTRVLARRHASSPLRFNCVHPGYVKTDMTLGTGELTAEEGAAGPVAVALSPPGGATGVFFIRTEPASFVD
uniref:UBX domain-containing protein n=1 Tax=Leersia perrieri TaxID=77586 RepID=A0A0D9VIT0_9ORYZ